MEIKLKYINGICGAGKTYAIAAWAERLADQGHKVLLVQPTTQLVHETIHTTFPAMNVDMARVVSVTSKTHQKVMKSIDEHLKTTDPQKGEVLVITHSAFFSLSYFHNPKNWIVVVDEIPPVERSFILNIPDTHELLTRHLEVAERGHPEYWSIEARDREALKKIAANRRGDEVYERFREFADSVISPHWATFVNAQNYERLTQESDVKGVARQLVGHAFMAPTVFEPFKAVYIAGACFTESLLFILWSNLTNPENKVIFEDASNSFALYRRQHDNGHLLDIYYGVDQPWSKTVRDKIVDRADGSTGSVFDAIKEKAKEMFGSQEVAEFANTDIKSPMFENAERLPNVTHGLNTYQHINHAFLMSALNPPPAHFAFLKRYADVNSDVVQTAMFRQAMYQAGNRTSIRDPKNTNTKMWFVPDSQTAFWLQSMYPGSRVHDLKLFKGPVSHGKPGRPAKHKDEAAKAKAYRERRDHKKNTVLERLVRLDMVNGLEHRNNDRNCQRADAIIERMTESHNIALTTIDKLNFQGTFFKDRFSTSGDAFEGSFDDLVVLYRDFAEMIFEDKGALPAYSPSMYVADNGSGTSRGYDNIAFVRNIILDFDGGDLSPEAFAAIFPGWRMVFHSSWSNTPERPRWRVIIPTNCLVDIENYKTITGYLMERLNAVGYWTTKELDEKPSRRHPDRFVGTHGFDITKLNPACVLFVPAKRPDSFFIEVPGEPINLYDLLETIPVPELVKVQPTQIVAQPVEMEPIANDVTPSLEAVAEALRAERVDSPATKRAAKVQKALDDWAAAAMLPGKGNSEFFRFGARLNAAGLSENEIEQHLHHEAAKARHPGERRAEIKNILRSLRRAA